MGEATWTVMNTTRKQTYRTFCVVFDTKTEQFCALNQATWSLNVDSAQPNQVANVDPLQTVASANPSMPPAIARNVMRWSLTFGPEIPILIKIA